MNNPHKPTKLSVFLISILLFGISLSSCIALKDRGDPSFTGDCQFEPSDTYHSYDFGSSDSKYVYVLVDKSYDYKFTPQDLKMISEKIIPNMYAGDRLLVGWISLEKTSGAIFFDSRIEREKKPVFPSTLTPPPVTPTLTPGGPTTTQGQQRQTSEAIDRDNSTIRDKYHCQIGEWNHISDELYKDWQSEQNEEINEFSDEAKNTITPSLGKESDNGKLLYESLAVSSEMLQSAIAKKQHAQYILIIFSDMVDWRPEKPDKIAINLKNVDVIIVSSQCKYEMDCIVKSIWQDQFDSFGTQSSIFLVQEDNISQYINDYLFSIP